MADRASELAHLRFALTLHEVLATHGGDSCYSPYSTASALGLASRAARGETATELTGLLAGHGADLEAHAELLRRAAVLAAAGEEQEDKPVLAVSNTLWAWDQLPVKPEFLDELAGWPSGALKTAPFVADPEGARRMINADVAEATHQLIPELLEPGSVGEDTAAGIVNALYLRAAWTLPFPESETREEDFHTPDGTRGVPTMHHSDWLGYTAAGGWQVVTLPVAGGLQAAVLLPDRDLAEQEAELTATTLRELLDGQGRAMVNLALPRFRLDVRSAMTAALQALGVRTMFTARADLGGLTDDDRLKVSEVLHQAVLRIDEQGLEGAAATAVMMRLVSLPSGDPVTVRVDRPFLFLVRHPGTGALYFLARVVRP
ncbi:serpin family protein [Amycolatopsis cihanbeyliensis]|uniref:Serpin B n=1 Tax=Amycolatopsis cihanbeyliensis TaxID=1128664 RepID=A0A542CTG9_AMYCI|nr:serpin family protein [Amycolatopsis cihanbeyliensis]TQI94113.1 serpin B [Amycolatopsis cihanbeyliensis]